MGGLLLAELAMRVCGVHAEMPLDPDVYVPDPVFGSALKPNSRGTWTREGRSEVSINSHGFRDRERAERKGPHVVRIAVIGDSFVEALQVPLKQTFWSQLECRLAESLPDAERQFEVLGFGVSGYGTAQESLLLTDVVSRFSPDLVILAFFAGNDVANNSRELEADTNRPFYTIAKGRLVLDNSFRKDYERRKSQREAFEQSTWIRTKHYFVTHSNLGGLLFRWRHRDELGGDEGAEAGLRAQVYREPGDDAWERAWRVTQRLLLKMRDDAAATGARFAVLSIPEAIQVYPKAEARKAFAASLEVDDLDYPERRLQSFCEHYAIPLVTLVEPMRAFAQERGVFLHGFENTKLGTGHLNAAGHAKAADLLAAFLSRNRFWLPPRE
jgi:lysophospholipase L1-like esterase